MSISCGPWVRRIYQNRLERIYRKARNPHDLPWYSIEPPPILLDVLQKRKTAGRALDLGSGNGDYAILLARHGYEVTGVDYVGEAVRLARENALSAGARVDFLKADVLTWRPDVKYDLILDAGCLHGITGKGRALYRKQLLEWLADDGDYILIHFAKSHLLDYCPIGPRRISRPRMVRWFAPELEEISYRRSSRSMPLPIGPVVAIGSYWFHRKKAGQ